MKINSINTRHYRKRGTTYSSYAVSKNAYMKREDLKQNNNNQINTTIKSNSDGRASFKGGTPFLHSVGNFVTYSPLIAEAIFALFITCGARPLTIMATAKTKEDKEKCSYQAAKSISSGIVGLAMTALVGTPIANAVKKAQKNKAFTIPKETQEKAQKIVAEGVNSLGELSKKLINEGKDIKLAEQINSLIHGDKLNLKAIAHNKSEKLFKQTIEEKAPEIAEKVSNAISQQKVLNNYSRTAKNVMDKLFQPIFMPIRATITVALVPVLLSLVGIKKASNNNNKKPNENPFNNLSYNVVPTIKDEKLFKSFAGVAKHENK